METPPKTLAVDGEPIQDIGAIDYLHTPVEQPDTMESLSFSRNKLVQTLSKLATGELVLLPEELSGISLPTKPGSGTVSESPSGQPTLHHIPKLEVGREHSRAKVAFGQLHIPYQSHTITRLVAVKYLPPAAVSREFFGTQTIDARFGERRTYRPLGFIKATEPPEGNTKDPLVGLITDYEHDVITLDNYLWNSHETPDGRETKYKIAGRAIAELHRHGLIHGDAQAKNFALDSRETIRHLDAETLQDLPSMATKGLNTITARLLDIHNMFDRQTLKIEPSPGDIASFTDGYLEEQARKQTKFSATDQLDMFTIQDVIDQARDPLY